MKIRNEYAKLQKENSELKIELQNYQDYIQNKPQKLYQKPIRKRKHYFYNKRKKVKKVILMLQKFADDQKDNEKE